MNSLSFIFYKSPAPPPRGLAFLRYSVLQIIYHPPKRVMAKIWLLFLRKTCGLKIIAITGTAGKTTTKEMVFSVLSQEKKVVASRENIDPVYNIVSSILSCRPSTDYLVLEMGVEFPGEMDFYLWLTGSPDVGVLLNVGSAHTEFFGDVAGVLEEKSKLIKALPSTSWAILNGDDARVLGLKIHLECKSITFGTSVESDVRASQIMLSPEMETNFVLEGFEGESHEIRLSLIGRQQVQNALVAVAVAKVFEVDIQSVRAGLDRVKPEPHRLQPIKLTSGTWLLDDTYNSNPLAVMMSLMVLKEVAGDRRTIAVLGEMKELGNYYEEGHREVGRKVAELGVDVLIGYTQGVRPLVEEAKSLGVATLHPETKDEVLRVLVELCKGNEVVLIKGSHSLKMDEIVADLIEKDGSRNN